MSTSEADTTKPIVKGEPNSRASHHHRLETVEGRLPKDDCLSTLETESRFSGAASSLASTQLPHYPSGRAQQPHVLLRPASSILSSSSYYQRPSSNVQARLLRPCPSSAGPSNSLPGSTVGLDSRLLADPHQPLISPRSSFLLGPTKSVIFAANNNADMSGVDENIYHWKVLNLSRAKLKASSRTSALLSGFAMVAMVEIQIDEKIPIGLLITFAVCTVLLIAVHMLALMISTCILPNVEAVANLHFQTSKTVFESPHMKMNAIVELAWGFSTVLGILLFLVEIAILCWVKFYSLSHAAAWTATGLLIPIMVIFIAFAAHFYLKLVSHKSEVYEDGIKELELLKDQLEIEDAEEGVGSHGNDIAANPSGASPSGARSAVQIV